MQFNGLIRAILFTSVTLFAVACATTPPPVPMTNIQNQVDAAGKKILAGQFLCYENDEPRPCYRGWRVYIKKNPSEEAARPIVPDQDGYVYLALDPGRYDFTRYTRSGASKANFQLNPYLTLNILPDDQIVNFGALEFRYSQSTGSKVTGFLFGSAPVYLKVLPLDQYEDVDNIVKVKFGSDAEINRRKLTFLRLLGQ